MYMTKIKAVLSVCLAAVLIFKAGSVSGAEFTDIEVKNDILKGTVSVSGKTDDVYALGICVTDTSVTGVSYTASVMENKTYALTQCTGDLNGEFSAILKMPFSLDTGTYRVFVYAEDGDGIYKNFEYSSQSKAVSVFDQLNTVTDKQKFISLIDENAELLRFDTKLYFKQGFDKTKTAEMFINFRPNGGFKNLDEMTQLFNAVCLSVYVSTNGSASETDAFLKENGKNYGDLSIYSESEDKVRLAVCTKLIKSFFSPYEIFDFIESESILERFKKAETWNDYPVYIQKFSEYFILTGSQREMLSALNDPDSIYRKLYTERNSFNSCEDIASKYTALIESTYKSQNESYNQGGTGGSGNGSLNIAVGGNTSSQTEKNEAVKDIFFDINEAQWAKEYITDLYNKRILSGNPDGYFYPNSSIKREEFVKMIVLAFDFSGMSAIDFSDVNSEDWYYDYVSTAAANGIIYGYDGKFGTGEMLTRQDLAVIVYRALKMKNIGFADYITEFTDREDIADYAVEAVGGICGLGVINGMPDGSFRPTENATRAQTAKIISMLLNNVE